MKSIKLEIVNLADKFNFNVSFKNEKLYLGNTHGMHFHNFEIFLIALYSFESFFEIPAHYQQIHIKQAKVEETYHVVSFNENKKHAKYYTLSLIRHFLYFYWLALEEQSLKMQDSCKEGFEFQRETLLNSILLKLKTKRVLYQQINELQNVPNVTKKNYKVWIEKNKIIDNQDINI